MRKLLAAIVVIAVVLSFAISARAQDSICSKSGIPSLGKTTAEVYADPAFNFIIVSIYPRDKDSLPLCSAIVTVRGVNKAWFRSTKEVNGAGQATFIVDPSASPDGPYVFVEVRVSSTETFDLELPVVWDGHTNMVAFATQVSGK